MTQSTCNARHKCADGGEGECSQPGGHHGRHLCRTCMGFFGAGEVIASDQILAHHQGKRGSEFSTDIPETTEYDCAHCPHYKALSTKRCPLCKNLICYHCDIYNCPTQFRNCAHCGCDIPAKGPNRTCIYCGYEICDNCSYSMYTCKKAPKCYHCGQTLLPNQERYVCYCNNMVHKDCMSNCPQKPASTERLGSEARKASGAEEPGASGPYPSPAPVSGKEPSLKSPGAPAVLGSDELAQELAFIDAKIADVQQQLDAALQKAMATKERAAAMHQAARDLMANPDTYEQGVEMERKAKAMENEDLDALNRLIEALSNTIKSLEETKRSIIRQMG
jgi:hypothetical protein